jgi:hypothetical protein
LVFSHFNGIHPLLNIVFMHFPIEHMAFLPGCQHLLEKTQRICALFLMYDAGIRCTTGGHGKAEDVPIVRTCYMDVPQPDKTITFSFSSRPQRFS